MSKQTDLINIPDAITVSGSNVGIGTSSPSATLHVSGQTRLEASGEAGPHTYRDGNSGNDIRFFSTNGTFASPTAKTPNSAVGQLHYSGHDGTTYRQNASIVVSVDGTVSTGTVPMRMTFHAGTTTNTERMRIDSAGRVTKPNHPAFFAVGNAGQTSYSAGAQVLIVNEQWDRNNNFSTSTGRFTAPVTGAYLFTYGFFSYEASKQFTIKVNNGDYAPSDTSGLIDAKDTSDMCNGTMLLYLTANDYVTVGYRSGASGSVYLNHCWFGGHLIG